ncbi:MAG: acetyl-CoA carboxylase biotin carboxyl carrier protein subunit [Bacteroidales bacterium]|nr:acetyl-CoA carboxylase biotin carboxyl carrier protein subunit [Bacteroidales bacterium]MBR4215086.1 acetyl-CoA carboxylase biotin carboxyl carrier protein subunit [Bacteroidales bacterium]
MNYDLLTIDSTAYRTRLTEKFKNRRPWQKPVYNLIKLQMPGKITQINITEGQQIASGDCLFVYEAMKMRNTVLAQMSGTIKKINVEVGQEVGKNFVLAEIER